MNSKTLEKAKALLSANSYEKLLKFLDYVPNVWHRPASSSGKYHKNKDGSVKTIDEHTVNMLTAAESIVRLFENSDEVKDDIYLGIILHDSIKYGILAGEHTVAAHDRIAAEAISDSKLFSGIVPQIVRYHQGRWSDTNYLHCVDANVMPYVFLVHILDMLETADKLTGDSDAL